MVAKRQHQAAFQLRKAAFMGQGLQLQSASASWEEIRDLVYEGRGG